MRAFADGEQGLVVLSAHIPFRTEAVCELVFGTSDLLGNTAQAIGTCSDVLELAGGHA